MIQRPHLRFKLNIIIYLIKRVIFKRDYKQISILLNQTTSIKEKTREFTLHEGSHVAKMHGRVEYIYFLKDGTLSYYVADEITEEEITLFSIERPGMVIGWELLSHPGRFISNIKVASQGATLERVEKEHFLDSVSTNDLIEICHQLYHLLETSFYQQTDLLSKKVRHKAFNLENYYISQESTLEEKAGLLRGSPFFGEFREEEIVAIADKLERREYGAEELIHHQDEFTGGIFILIQGEVSIRRLEGTSYLDLRSISSPGYIFGWSAAFSHRDICRATAEHKTSVYFLPEVSLQSLTRDSSFGIAFYKTLIWLIGNQIQLSQSRFIHLLDERYLISVKHLIDVNRPHIPLPSPLHQIPHLLKDNSTHPLAFSLLHKLFKNGTKQERQLASISLDLLKNEEREANFLGRIADVYKTVSSGDPLQASENRKQCAILAKEVFRLVEFHLEGIENLPKKSGNIFIYNHLVNHPVYTLNNRFQLTLDSHFISALILDEQYGDPGVRTVRIGKSFEYGHQDYYDNLGYINVYTKDSDLQSDDSRKNAKEKFYKEAEDHLRGGTNLIISPEGTSYITEESPGPFKMGPFNVATNVSEEPHIVPIVFCNFDKRINEAPFFCRVLKPFKISEQKAQDESLKDFVMNYQQTFSHEVDRARRDADGLLNQMSIL